MQAPVNTSRNRGPLRARTKRLHRNGVGPALLAALTLLLADASGGAATPAVSCDNDQLTAFDGLLVVAPHPDDETLGFAGLLTAYRLKGKPVRTVVATDGDAYCVACAFWKSGSTHGATCDADDLSNLATPDVDSFAELRRSESSAAATVLGLPAPRFLAYPDTGLAAAWRNRQQGEAERPLRRSDFSMCEDCDDCSAGSGGGPPTELTSASFAATIAELLAATTPGTLVATTHPLDGHGDHAALGEFVRAANGELAEPRALAFAVIHAHTRKDTAHSDCWYPGPQAAVCPCHDEERASADPTWLAEQRAERLQPAAVANLPDDATYGEERQLCLPPAMVAAEPPTKLAALETYASQLGFAAREGEVPEALEGLVDCNGYLLAFVRRTEAFVLVGGDQSD
jgi:LmbE family N-acetylglucosaminyl deacetylase